MRKKEKKIWGMPQLILATVILLAAVAALTMSILWQINEFSLKLTMRGEKEITIEYGGTYEEAGAEAVFRGTVFNQDPENIEVTWEGQVDPSTVGTYHIDYSVKHTINYAFGQVVLTDYARRTVHIIDTVAPEITLVADPDVFTIPGEIYQEEGFTATDNYDGDITDRVVRTETEEAVTYTVTDSSGNSCQVERIIVYHDPIPPELTLKGNASITLEVGQVYQEPGYTATDNCDGDITDRVTVTGTVNTEKAGTYTLEYTVVDSYENSASAKRTVNVIKPEPEPLTETKAPTDPTRPTEPKDDDGRVDPANPVGGVIYLTFDDGPGGYTGKLLDILAKYNVKASFFVVNTGNYSALTRMANEGHTVAIHTATHDFHEIYASEEAFFADLEKMQSIIQTHTGIKPMLMRFPGGSSNTISRFNPGIMTRLTKLVEEKGYTYFDWNVDSNDAGGTKTSTGVYNNVVSAVANRKTSVVLMHDIKGYTVNAIEDIIIWGLENGYTFKPLTADSPTCHHGINN
ncbi:MAG: polysaccharide deacetylase family protein [Oscillospiraceae bacterium]|nr:polysaccharide deacetylase family protein [Oscillospiraceae bacterium]